MATIQLGAVVTNIAGSVGGTTFKRGVNQISVYNKPRGGSKNSRKNTNHLSFLGSIFRAFSLLSAVDIQSWVDYALSIRFPDKFGNYVNLTAREVFVKLNSQLSVVDSKIDNAFANSPNIGRLVLNSFSADLTGHTFVLDVVVNDFENYVLVQVDYSSSRLRSPIFNRKKIIFWSLFIGAGSLDITNEVLARFPYMQVGGSLRLYVTLMALNGLRGTTQVIESVIV